MRRKHIFTQLIILFFTLQTGVCFAQQSILIFQGGMSKDMRSQTSNRWNSGPDFAISYFVQKSDRLSIGGQVSYHRWKADGKGWLEDFRGYVLDSYSTYSLKNSSGTQTVFEITPSARYKLSESNAPVSFSLQVGANLVLANESDVIVGYDYTLPNTIGFEEFTITSTSLTGFGIQLGVPITISNRFEVLPLYSPYFAGGDIYHHYAINLGIALGL